MSEPSDKKFEYQYRRRHNSFFGPIVLIAIGVYFLLSNLGYISGGLNWMAALQLWPLALILLGINVIVRQAPGPLGGFLSALVGLAAVAIFGYVLFFGEDNALLNRFGIEPVNPTEVKTEHIELPVAGVETAVITLDLGMPAADVYALNDSRSLIEGDVSYLGDLVFDTNVSDGRAVVRLDDEFNGNWFLNPSNWANFNEMDRWQIGLNPSVATDLTVDVGAGSASLDLRELTLTDLEIDGGAGSTEVWLPGGDYDAMLDVSAGSTKLTLPGYGRQQIEVDGGAGSLILYLPPGVETRVEVDGGAGSFSFDQSRFHQISGDQKDEGIWETPGYEAGRDGLELIIDVSAGSVRIEDVQGR
ncbi:MAG: hypothetical protein H6667_18795 [Ardenticatenaceae bacterium]|nr:hypothetical protein [Ardenticatenaceae bacterium]